MKKLVITTALLTLTCTAAFAADNATPAAPPVAAAPSSTTPLATPTPPAPAATGEHKEWHYHAKTLTEARKTAHEKADKLDKMTEEEYAKQQKDRHDRREAWKHMTPEEKSAAKKERYAKWHHKGNTPESSPSSAAPAAGGE